LSQRYAAVADVIAQRPVDDAILDGEASWASPDSPRISVFDIMWLDGHDVTSLPLEEHRALLRKLLLRAPRV